MHRRGDIGFKHRDPGDDIYNDSKDFFHFHPFIFEKYQDFINKNPVVATFLNEAHILWKEVYRVFKEVLGEFDKLSPGAASKIFDNPHPHILLRFLKYDWNRSGKYLAKPHFDAGSFTLAVAESCPGLRIGTGLDDLELIQHQDGKVIFMAASNLKKIVDIEGLSPGWHDVIQLDETKIGKHFARWAIVAFCDGHSVEALPRAETHKYALN